MSWHDNTIYALAFGVNEHEIMFDIDYILEWINPDKDEVRYKFIVVPATLVFRNVYDLSIAFSLLDVTIDEIYRKNFGPPGNAAYINEQTEYEWTIETSNGTITFNAVGYIQYAKQTPRILDSQSIELIDRQGISLTVCSG